jgi:uncharacterized protein (TIGR03084 family)
MTQQTQQDVFTALAADAEDVDRLVAGISPEAWQRETPAQGWTIAHQVAHLAATFRMAALAAAEPEAFTAMLEHLSPDFDANVRTALSQYVNDPPEVLLSRWRDERDAAVKALTEVSPEQPLPWLVRPLPAPVLAMAGMMECFGHGQDIADALGVERERTDRLQYLCAFAVRTWDFGYQARGLTPPPVVFRFELTGPSGAEWTFGPDDAEQRITGPAVDFCLLVTRRRHPDDLAVRATGPDAEQWIEIAQAYRGPAGPGREPGQFG